MSKEKVYSSKELEWNSVIRYCNKCYITFEIDYYSGIYSCQKCGSDLFCGPSGWTERTQILILRYEINQKDKLITNLQEQINDLQNKFSNLEVRMSELEFSGPSPIQPNGGPEFKKLFKEAMDAGDFQES